MAKIIRAVCISNSFDDDFHRVKITSEGTFKELLVDNLNGIYLRKDDEVYVFIEDELINPMILGRCSGQLEIQDLLDLINNFIDVFNKHTHKIPSGFVKGTSVDTTALVGALSALGVTTSFTSSVGTDETDTPSGDDVEEIEPDDILY